MCELMRCNNAAGIYWLKQCLEDISIRIKIRSKESILTLPKFEEYKEKSDEENLHLLENNKIEEYDFKWQQKMFSKWEFQKYTDIHNCNSETELKYYDMIKKLNCVHNKLFTYIDEDYYLPLPLKTKNNRRQSIIPYLNKCFNKLNVGGLKRSENLSNSMNHLFRSEDKLNSDEDQWTEMHIVQDNSEYNEDSQLLYKDEQVLLSLYHNVTLNYLIVSPDVNDIQFNAYQMVSHAGLEYGVEIEFIEESGAELKDLLNNLLRKWEKKYKGLLSFVMPPLGTKKIYLTFEIVSAEDFDMDNLYIEFDIKIPDDLMCSGDLHGRTHVSKYLNIETTHKWGYGHILDLELECATGIDPHPIKIFLETISVDWWGRHRTEGYSYLPLSLEPGEHKRQLSCLRPEELDSIEANNRRFFVGGCHLIKDLDVLVNPQLHNANFKYISTGTVFVRWRVISQTQMPGTESPVLEASSSDLLRGAEAVLRQYKKAKATLEAATRDLPTTFDGPEDG